LSDPVPRKKLSNPSPRTLSGQKVSHIAAHVKGSNSVIKKKVIYYLNLGIGRLGKYVGFFGLNIFMIIC
jgi:hypothetical protein